MNMFNVISGKAKDLLSLYIIYFKISFYKNPKLAEENLDILFSLLNEIQDVREWNRTLKILAKAWNTTAPESNNIVNIVQTKKNILNAIHKFNLEDKSEYNLFMQAENNVEALYDGD